MVDACVFLLEHGLTAGIYNIGSGAEVSIGELQQTVMEVVGFTGKIVIGASKPDGTPRELLDVLRLEQHCWQAR
jgi:GDP-L-fucose synthase